MNSQERVLVTGGAGYIGSHVCKALAAAGYLPVTYDDLSRGHQRAVKWGPLERGGLDDGDRLGAVLSEHRPCGVIHLAAFAYVGESAEDPLLYYRNNIGATVELLSNLRAAGVANFVYSSSCGVYGTPDTVPIPETESAKPVSPYGFTKHAVERLLVDCDQAFGLRSIALRYFNAAGADPDGEIGEEHDPETHLVPLALDCAAGRRDELVLFGDDYDTPDGTCIRDYVHVSDLAEAHVAALEALRAGARTQALNLANGDGYSVKQVIDTVRAVTGAEVLVRTGPRRPGDPARLVGDARRAKETLGWRPRYSLEDQISHAWKWHCSRASDT